MLKKILPVLKKTSAVFAACLVFVSCLFVPSFAVDISTSTTSSLMQPLFNYDYVEVIYTDGGKACFNIKDVFYRDYGISDSDITYSLTDTNGTGRSIDITFNYVDFQQITYINGEVNVNLPFWVLNFEMDVSEISSVFVHAGETIYDCNFFGAVYTLHYDSVNFYRSDYANSTASFYSGQTSSFYYPSFQYGNNAQIVGRSLSSLDVGRSGNSTQSINISPYVDVNSLVSRFPPTITRYYYYFSDVLNNIQIPSDAQYMRFNVGYIPSDNVITFKTYHDTYFPAYVLNLDSAVDFSGWISTALTGFLNFEFAPGLKLSTLLLFMLGVGAFNIFLKFFAGG